MALSTAVLAKLASPVQKSSGVLKEAAIDRAFNNAFSMGVALMVNADMTRLAQAFVNLLNNAAKYSEQGGRTRLSVERLGTDAVVTVKDTGIGIPAEQLPREVEGHEKLLGS